MPLTPPDRSIVENLFKAMQEGATGEEAMMALFDDDSVFIEPFSGTVRTHTGKPAIRAAFRSTWENPIPELRLRLDRVDLDGDQVRAEWTCTSPIFPEPMKGVDLFTIRAGRIARLEIVILDTPEVGR
jgi:hypothetical protein